MVGVKDAILEGTGELGSVLGQGIDGQMHLQKSYKINTAPIPGRSIDTNLLELRAEAGKSRHRQP